MDWSLDHACGKAGRKKYQRTAVVLVWRFVITVSKRVTHLPGRCRRPLPHQSPAITVLHAARTSKQTAVDPGRFKTRIFSVGGFPDWFAGIGHNTKYAFVKLNKVPCQRHLNKLLLPTSVLHCTFPLRRFELQPTRFLHVRFAIAVYAAKISG